MTSQRRRHLAAFLAAAIAPVGAAAAMVPLRARLPNATIALAIALTVALLAAVGTRASAAIAAVSAGAGFDVFHTRPYGSLAINRAADIETTVLLLAVGIVVGQLATRNRLHRDLAADSSYDLGRIHAVAEMVASGEPADQVVLAVANELADLLALKECHYSAAYAERPGPFIERDGDVSWGALRWGFQTMGLPGKEVSLSVEHQGRPLGRYVLLGEPGVPVNPDALIAAVALADQAGAALAARHA
jgi:K+-sensing histidine kinase KdpD